jgi:hypothetical protein
MKSYQLPQQFENLPPVTIIEHEGKYYSFGATLRSVSSIWEEVKDKLDTLITLDFTEEDILEIAPYEEKK